MTKTVLVTIFIGVSAFFSVVLLYYFFSPNKYNFIEDRIMGDTTTNFLYVSEINDKKYYFTTDSLLDKDFLNDKYPGQKLSLVSQDEFWNPRLCAGMKNFSLGNKKYFFETKVKNDKPWYAPEGFEDFLYIYNEDSNVLQKFKLNKHLNILNFKDEIVGGYISLDVQNEEKVYEYILDLNSLEFEKIGLKSYVENSNINPVEILDGVPTVDMAKIEKQEELDNTKEVLYDLLINEQIFFFLLR